MKFSSASSSDHDVPASGYPGKAEGALSPAGQEAGAYIRGYATAVGLAADLSLAEGMCCQTIGYQNAGDKGGAFYVIEAAPYLWGSVALANGLYANLVDHERVNAIALGFRSDGTDNGPVLEALMAKKRLHTNLWTPLTIVFPIGDFVFSPVRCDTNNFRMIGSGIVNNRRGCTRFMPAGDQEYILLFGRNNPTRYGPNGSEWMYRGNSVKNIFFTTLKYGECGEKGNELTPDNWWRISGAGLLIYRQTWCEFDDLLFHYFAGTCISISASYEITFGKTYMYTILAMEKGAVHFAYDIGNDQIGYASDISALYFDYLALESVMGDCITFDILCDAYNTMFNVINFEDGSSDKNFGGIPTKREDPWLPDGYTEPDVNLAIFRFKERCSTDQTIVNQIQMQNMCLRTYIYEGKVYARTALMAVDAFVYDAALNVGIADIRSIKAKAPFYPLYCPSPYTGQHIGLYIGRFITNMQGWDIRPYGYVRNYYVGYDHGDERDGTYDARRSPLAPAYTSVYDNTVVSNYSYSFVREEIQTYSPYSTKYVGIHPAAGKGSEEALSWNKVCALPILPKVFSEVETKALFGRYYIRIPLTGDLLNVRIKLEAYDELIYAIAATTGREVKVVKYGNLRDYHDLGWQWIQFDMSEYKGLGYFLSFGMRQGAVSEPLIDVYYWKQKNPAVPGATRDGENENRIKKDRIKQ